MTIKKQLTIACLFAALLAGCASTADNTDDNAFPALIDPATAPPSSASAMTSTPEPTNAPTTAPVAEAKPLYRMNGVYRFVPLDETTTKKAVLLTFDDGPKDEKLITSLFDTLDMYHAKAIFFVNGYRIKANPELLELIYERGGTIGNHSYDHINLKNEKEDVVEEQLSSVQQMVEKLTGTKPKFFRPPFGSGGDTVKEIAKNHDMLYMTWSNGSLDWDSSARDKPEVVIRNVMDQLHPGANILMHELPWTAEALDELLGKIEAEGYSFIDPATIELTN
ncbi:polysaccharide deacetylase family protein [Paenibacillus paeoniae]|uniref:Polysaccharide deacetylase family protein n=1 Tax=Paenibacillus paeoniae TaxID=2292705 RepID=A0A371PM46_9BACL|nr:polysaccharide deacetylase family protein [Paenibacillus paeoniae]REK77282.1 polysaccharide deacetylase family protein [Paenibacillus paeoniae]